MAAGQFRIGAVASAALVLAAYLVHTTWTEQYTDVQRHVGVILLLASIVLQLTAMIFNRNTNATTAATAAATTTAQPFLTTRRNNRQSTTTNKYHSGYVPAARRAQSHRMRRPIQPPLQAMPSEKSFESDTPEFLTSVWPWSEAEEVREVGRGVVRESLVEIKKLESSLAESASAVTTAQEALKTAVEANTRADKALHDQNQVVATLTAERDDLQRTIGQLKVDLAAKEEEIAARVADKASAVAAGQATEAGLQSNIDELKAEIESIKEAARVYVREAEAKQSRLETELVAAKALAASTGEKLGALQTDRDDIAAARATAMASVDQLMAEKSDVELAFEQSTAAAAAAAAEKQSEIASLTSQLKQVQDTTAATIADLNQAVAALQTGKEEASAALAAAEATLSQRTAELTDEIQSHKDDVAAKNAAQSRADAAAAAAEEQVSSLNKQLDQMQTDSVDAAKALAAAKADTLAAEVSNKKVMDEVAEKNALAVEKDAALSRAAEAEEKVAKLEKQLEAMEATGQHQLNILNDQVDKLEADLGAKSTQVDQLTANIKSEQTIQLQLQAQANSLKAELEATVLKAEEQKALKPELAEDATAAADPPTYWPPEGASSTAAGQAKPAAKKKKKTKPTKKRTA